MKRTARANGQPEVVDASEDTSLDKRLLLQALQRVKAGDFSVQLPTTWTGMDGKIADTFRDIVTANQTMARELKRVGQVVGKEGRTRERTKFEQAKGSWGEMESSVNTLIDDLLRPTTEVTGAIAAVARGHLTQTMRLDVDGRPLEGEFLRSATIVNTMIQQLGIFTSEVTRVAREVGSDGKLGGQAQVPGVSGVWKDLTDSVNSMASNLDEFLALLAHELRNPLAPVRNAVTIMRMKGSPDPELAWCRDVIERQANHLTRLVDDLLDVSRITKGKINLHIERLDLGTVIAGAVETSRPLIDATKHELVLSLPAKPIAIEGDPTRLNQVVANLLNNAAKYQNERGRIELTVTRQGSEALISVKDHGVGVAPEMLAQIFELFSQGERSPDRAQGGLGIGLSLVRNLVEMHGGTVRAMSGGRGLGSEFLVQLPCLPEEPAALGTSIPDPKSLAILEPCRILVVDDSKDAAESMARLLRLAGHEVLMAHDGHKALEIAVREQPSIVLLDIGLPGMDGYEVCRRLRQQCPKGTRIIAVTGYGQDRDRQRSHEAGFDAHTVKPVDPAELIGLLAGC